MTVEIPPIDPLGALPRPAVDASDAAKATSASETAKAFETVFLTEMLKHAGLGDPQQSFGGGVGEAAFSDFLTAEWAELLAEAGGVGVADAVEKAIAARSVDDA